VRSWRVGLREALVMRSLHEALQLSAGTDDVAFRGSFDASAGAEWTGLVTDLVAMANSGGGIVLIGLDEAGRPTGAGLDGSSALDVAALDDRVHRETGIALAGLRVIKVAKEGAHVLAVEVEATPYPVVLLRDGTLRFRHDGRTATGTVDDVRRAFEREIARRSDGWIENLRRVLAAPPGSMVSVTMPSELAARGAEGVPVRLVDDPHAPAVPRWSPDDTHPHRLKDVVAILNERLAGKVELNVFDLLCVRRAYETDRIPGFFYKSKVGTPQYSDAFVEWILDHYARDPHFFTDARSRAPRWRAKSA
jgi:hypothetical protein